MTATLAQIPRIPFDYSAFYPVMFYYLGREPDRQARHGHDGFFDFIYTPKDEAEKKKFRETVHVIATQLDKYDIVFSRSMCSYQTADQIFGEHLRVTITHPVTKETTEEAEARSNV